MNGIMGSGIRVMFFDLDGCIYFGGTLADRANDLLRLLRLQGIRIGFITNNSRENAAEIRSKLYDMGLNFGEEPIITATEAVGDYVASRHGQVVIKVAGSSSLSGALANSGHRIVPWEAPELANLIVIGRDFKFDYTRLQQIVNEVRAGSLIVSTNPDTSHPGQAGELVPETGSLLAAVQAILGEEIVSIGKPHPYLYEVAMRTYGVSPSECLMVGDNLTTDIAGAMQAGIQSVWIRNSALSSKIEIPVVPTVTVDSLSQLYHLIASDRF